MCGICGIAAGKLSQTDIDVIPHITEALLHRGPDDTGIERVDESVIFGFRRLAILDLSSAGHQPMFSPDKSRCIVLNGEIYNYRELGDGLKSKGYRFKGRSDTEVVLSLFAEYGTDSFAMMNGMFAMAVYDAASATVTLARDRMGKKPLFYSMDQGKLIFASELKGLLRIHHVPPSLNVEALHYYLRLGFIPNWMSIYHNVHKLPPGHWLQWSVREQRVIAQNPYWQLPDAEFDYTSSEHEWIERIDELLDDATRIRLRSDVPLGIFLSAGIDSGLVAAAAAKAVDNTAGLTSLTVSLPGWEKDEWPLASQVGRHLGLTAVHRELDPESMKNLPALAAHFDEPFSDHSMIPTFLICKAARERMTVVLSGDGGDELFAGYQNHLRAYRYRTLERIPAPVRTLMAALGRSVTRPDSAPRRFLNRLPQPAGFYGLGAKVYLFEEWLQELIKKEFYFPDRELLRASRQRYGECISSHALDTAQRHDMRLYLLDDVLVKVDRMSMLNSLEVRSPLLDYRLVELALKIPPDLRTRNGWNKYLLRRLAEKKLPKASLLALKRGFGFPVREWIFSGWPGYARDLICNSKVFAPGKAEVFWLKARDNPALTSAAFRIITLELWLQGNAITLH